ncbi:hypothetical protein OCU04_006314 [Sclerotinia nivalis]|uniref:Uncharacterized protein n=1 Tax=Sclerotinia nivalis TaxID=352851 RepID=A0A9X0DKF5_9HELO|nr:hypothetical protein OCU04_006314 [Sclerotinia nivalis]
MRRLEDMVLADDYFEMREDNLNFQVILNQSINGSQDLQARINGLVEENAMKESLVKVGAYVHLRFLEQGGREVNRRDHHFELNQELLDGGNIAAHNGILRADVALFQSSLIPENYMMEARTVFQELY